MTDGDKNGVLPEGWTTAPLGEIADCRLGKMLDRAKNRGEPRPYLRNINVQWGRIDLHDVKEMRIEAHETEQYAVLPGDLLVCEGGEPGRCAVWRGDEEMYLQKALHRVRPRDGVSPEYLRWWLRGCATDGRLAELVTGSTIKHLPGRQLARLEVSVPPVAEQRRIAARLDEIDTHTIAAATHLQLARVTVERFRSAVLAAACSGRLTEDPRETDGGVAGVTPVSWLSTTLGDLADSIRGGSSQVPIDDVTEYPVLRSSSVRPFSIDYADVRYLADAQSQSRANFVEEGDLLVTRLSGSLEYVGNAALVAALGDRRLQYPDRLFRVRLIEPRHARFVQLFFASPKARAQIESASRSAAGHQRISISDLRSLSIALPPLREQEEIVRRTEAMLSKADRLMARVDLTATALARVSRASLAEAFRGNLVPTEAAFAAGADCDFESADELLARIADETRLDPRSRTHA